MIDVLEETTKVYDEKCMGDYLTKIEIGKVLIVLTGKAKDQLIEALCTSEITRDTRMKISIEHTPISVYSK